MARWLVLVTAVLGFLFAGVQLSITALVMRAAASDLLGTTREELAGDWFGRLTCAFLLGAATGGYLFGWLGDRHGRAKAMAVSILWFSVFSGLTYFVAAPWQLLALRFVTCMGIGGMWPNGISLVSETWPDASRPFLAGVIGTAANGGIMLFAALASFVAITPDHWRWALLLGSTPVALGVFVFLAVPESPRWLALPRESTPAASPPTLSEVFRPPWWKVTLLGIALGTVPLFGGWNSSNWVNPWADQVGEQIGDPGLKARIHFARSACGSVASMLGGILAYQLGRRRCYLWMSLGALFSAQYMFWFTSPDQPDFIVWAAILGFFSGSFYGWLPLCLPELFPTRIRSTGVGVSYNFGRILTAVAVLVTSLFLSSFHSNYAVIGRITSCIYAAGMIVILVAPNMSNATLRDE
ncbi:MAG: MFS transporter [Pirellulaceae bacterium]